MPTRMHGILTTLSARHQTSPEHHAAALSIYRRDCALAVRNVMGRWTLDAEATRRCQQRQLVAISNRHSKTINLVAARNVGSGDVMWRLAIWSTKHIYSQPVCWLLV